MTPRTARIFERIRDALAPADWEPHADPSHPAPSGEASVALVLRAVESPEVLLVRRSLSEEDPWSGHMALPGGRRDPIDVSPLDTAIRETEEECGLVLDAASALGRLAPVSPQTIKVPTLRVTPFVFGIAEDVSAHVASHEIDALFWVPLEQLRDPRNRHTVQIPLITSYREFPAFQVAGQTVWGMTYRVISRFLDHYEGSVAG